MLAFFQHIRETLSKASNKPITHIREHVQYPAKEDSTAKYYSTKHWFSKEAFINTLPQAKKKKYATQ